jgi:cytochrome c
MQLRKLLAGFAVVGLLSSPMAFADESPIAAGDYEAFNAFITEAGIMPPCTTCHKLDTKLVGPSYNAVALYYKDKLDDEAEMAALVERVTKGGSGVWGAIPMPPNAAVSAENIKILVDWVLALEVSDEAAEKAAAEIAAKP